MKKIMKKNIVKAKKIIEEYNYSENRTYYYREVAPSKWPKKLALILISILGVWIFGQSMVLIFFRRREADKTDLNHYARRISKA